MIKKSFFTSKNILIAILIFAAFTRLFRLDYPNNYVFDEVYHAFTAKEYLKGNKEAWNPFASPPPGVAYEWLHPPIAKELMTASMFIFRTTDAWAWRLPGVLLNLLSIYLIFQLGLLLFKNKNIALISAFLFSIEGLVFVQSRTGMNDAHLVAFILLSLVFFLRGKFFLAAIFMGVAMSTKWPGVFLYAMYIPLLLYYRKFSKLIYFILIPPLIYLLSYAPYFLLGYKVKDFIELHKQIWWYQTNLKATHDYSSPWWSWPLNLYPVWYFVEYHKNGLVSNIFASGNPLLFWIGTGSLIATIWDFIKTRSKSLFILLCGFLIFWAPWAISPRIMFFYHYSPSVPFMCLAVGYQLGTLLDDKHTKKLTFIILGLIFISFLLIYPMLTGIPLERKIMMLFFDTNITKNPFM